MYIQPKMNHVSELCRMFCVYFLFKDYVSLIFSGFSIDYHLLCITNAVVYPLFNELSQLQLCACLLN